MWISDFFFFIFFLPLNLFVYFLRWGRGLRVVGLQCEIKMPRDYLVLDERDSISPLGKTPASHPPGL